MNKKIAMIAAAILTSLTVVACDTSTPPANTSNAVRTNDTQTTAAKSSPSGAAQKTTPVATARSTVPTGPLPGDLLIADRGNSRLLIVTPDKRTIWSMQVGDGSGPHNENSLGPDDAFFTPDQKHIIVNEEDNHVLAMIDIATKKIVWQYGHAGKPGMTEGYLNTPDDAYQLPDGTVTVADIRNQRILFISPDKHVIKQYGINGYRYHNPPKSFAAPNGDTPLPDGGMMVTEIGGSYADRLDKNGKLVYSVHFKDVQYPSDTQLLPNGNLLVADYVTPGRVEIVNKKGDIIWEYYRSSGPGALANPSLAIMLPNGNVALNDDLNHRVVIINPKLNRIVWQYGHLGVRGTAPDYLNAPDGMDFVPPTMKLPVSGR